jgi:FkbM family methyltransferase
VFQAARRRRLERRMAGPRLLRAFAEEYPTATFVEIGANDGEQHDLLRPFVLAGGWRGVVVEPVPYVFERLARNYAGQPGLALENVAVAPEDGRRRFFHLAEAEGADRERLPEWYDGIGSLFREEVLSHRRHIPDIDSRLVETEVDCVTLETLCHRHGIDRLDLLAVDTEGYDWEILRHVDIAALAPRLIVYEHYHLGPEDRRAAREHLRGSGYETMEEHFDTFCLDSRPGDALVEAWRGLGPAVPGVAAYEEAR